MKPYDFHSPLLPSPKRSALTAITVFVGGQGCPVLLEELEELELEELELELEEALVEEEALPPCPPLLLVEGELPPQAPPSAMAEAVTRPRVR